MVIVISKHKPIVEGWNRRNVSNLARFCAVILSDFRVHLSFLETVEKAQIQIFKYDNTHTTEHTKDGITIHTLCSGYGRAGFITDVMIQYILPLFIYDEHFATEETLIMPCCSHPNSQDWGFVIHSNSQAQTSS